MGEYMEESHTLELDTFAVKVLLDDDGESEVIFSRDSKPVFRASVRDLKIALTFVEKHGEVEVVQR